MLTENQLKEILQNPYSKKIQSFPFSSLKTLIFTEIKVFKDVEGINDVIVFLDSENNYYVMLHLQDCCEDVFIEDICGDLEDICNSPILNSEEIIDTIQHDYDSYTFSFYKIDTNKGGVTIRWNGSSNGYYSETVDFF